MLDRVRGAARQSSLARAPEALGNVASSRHLPDACLRQLGRGVRGESHPYVVYDDAVELCLQIQGERRPVASVHAVGPFCKAPMPSFESWTDAIEETAPEPLLPPSATAECVTLANGAPTGQSDGVVHVGQRAARQPNCSDVPVHSRPSGLRVRIADNCEMHFDVVRDNAVSPCRTTETAMKTSLPSGDDLILPTLPPRDDLEVGSQSINQDDYDVCSQSSKLSVHSFWDSVRMLTGCDVRPRQLIRQHLGSIPQITRNYDELLAEVAQEDDADQDLMERFRRRVSECPPPPVSAEQWTRAAFRVAESSLFDLVHERVERSRTRGANRAQAASSLSAAMLHVQPIDGLPPETSRLIAAATGDAGHPPAPVEPRMTLADFFRWFQSLHRELHPDREDLTESELLEEWDAMAMRELAMRGSQSREPQGP